MKFENIAAAPGAIRTSCDNIENFEATFVPRKSSLPTCVRASVALKSMGLSPHARCPRRKERRSYVKRRSYRPNRGVSLSHSHGLSRIRWDIAVDKHHLGHGAR